MTPDAFKKKYGTDTWKLAIRSSSQAAKDEVIRDIEEMLNQNALFDIVCRLTGPIMPVGETHEDERRFVNLNARINLMKALHLEMDKVACEENAPEFSVRRAGATAAAYIGGWLGVEE